MEHKELIKKVRRLEIQTRKKVHDILAGSYHSVFKGQGIEFLDVKEYTYGDDIKNIDWNVTARSDKAYVKRYVEERELTVIIAIDASGSQSFGTRLKTKHELTLELSALLAFSALQNKDKVGLLIFSDKIDLFVPAKKSKNHVLRIIREIADQDRQVGYKTDIHGALEYLNRVLRRRAIIFFVSDFIDEGYRNPLKIAGNKHDFVAIQVHDPLEIELPKAGLIFVTDNETGEQTIINTNRKKVRKAFKEAALKRMGDIDRLFQSLGVDRIKLSTAEEKYLITLIKFFKQRSKRF